jgi:osmoprotectant transport system permease protein
MAFFTFAIKQYRMILELLLQHLAIVGLSLAIAVCFALPVGYFLSRNKWASAAVVGFFSAIYAVPSLALFAIMLPFTGLGMRTAVIVISIYAQYILLRSVISGFESVGPSILEAGRGMGLRASEMLFTIQLPLAAPIIMSGIRIAAIASVGLAAIAATIHSGGIGVLLFDGISHLYAVKILWGVVLSVLFSYAANLIFGKAEIFLTKRAHV